MASTLLKTLSMAVIAAAITFGSATVDAKKFGGGKSVGSQRESVSQPRPASPTAAPASPNAAASAAPAAAAAPKSGLAKWAGPLAGIAAAIGMGYLFSQMGAGGFLGFLIVAVLLVIGLVFLARNFARKQTLAANGAPMPGAMPNAEPFARESAPATPSPVAGSALAGGTAVAGLASGFGIPADFDKAGFEANAKKQFMALQAANDKGDLDAVRDFATDEFYNQIAKDVIGGNKEATQVDELNANLLGVETERNNYWASVEFTGKMREDGMVMASPFREVWNLVKPVDGSKGWLLAGIQQV